MNLSQVVETSASATMPFSPVEGVAGIALLMVAADGCVSHEEVELLNASVFRMKLFDGFSNTTLKQLFNKMTQELKQQSCDDFLRNMVGAVPAEMAMSVFAIAADIAFSDGELSDEEQAILEFIYGLFEIPRDMALQILQVMEIKNQY